MANDNTIPESPAEPSTVLGGAALVPALTPPVDHGPSTGLPDYLSHDADDIAQAGVVSPSPVRFLRARFYDASGRFPFLDGQPFVYLRSSPSGRVLIGLAPTLFPIAPSLAHRWPADPAEVFHDGSDVPDERTWLETPIEGVDMQTARDARNFHHFHRGGSFADPTCAACTLALQARAGGTV